MMTTRNSGNVELALCNDSDCSERTSSGGTFSDYDMAIVNRLQYLTQRVEDLERKLEKRMPNQSDDLSFALSVNNNNSVPNVDIKVLSGPREPYHNPTGDEDLMSGWDDGIVERNTSFLIIPVGDDKDFQLNGAQRLKQTLDGTLEPTTSLSALCYADTPHNNSDEINMDADEDEESLQVNNSHTTPFTTTHRAISVSNIIPSGNFTNQGNIIKSEHIESTSDSSSVRSNECSSDDIKVSGNHEQKVENKQVTEKEPSDEQQNMEKMVKHMEKFATTSRGESPHIDGTLKYGYTISIAGVNPQEQEHKTKTVPFQPRVFHFENINEKDITPERRPSDNRIIRQDVASVEENKSKIPRYVVRSTVLPKSVNVCYQDAGTDEMAYQRNDNEPGRLNGNDDICDDDPSIKIDPGLSKHDVLNQNFVKSHTCNSHSIEKQLKNAECLITAPQESRTERVSAMNSSSRENMSLFDDVVIEKEVEEITNRVHRTMGNRIDEEDEKIQMQIERKDRLSRCKDFYCPGNGSDGAYVLSNNTTADGGLGNYNTNHNTSGLKEIAVDCYGVNDLQNNPLHKNTRHRCASNKTALRKLRVRSQELPLTSSEEDLSLTMLGDIDLSSNPRTTRPQRKKQRNKTVKPTLAARNNMACQEPLRNLERKLKELIDPGEIGNLQEDIAAVNRPLLLAVMSPTDSGYIGSNADSPRDAWKDHYYESPYCSQPSTPVNQYSSPKDTLDPKERPAGIDRQDEVYLSPRSAHHSVGSHSSASSTVSYLGGSDYSEISTYGDDRGAYPDPTVPPLRLRDPEINSRLSEYFPGPSRIPFDNYSSTVRLNEYLLNRHPIASPTSSVGTSDLSDSFFGCESDYCECQTGIATEHDFRAELKSMSRLVLEAGEKTGVMKKTSKPLKRYFLDEEQGEMDIFGARLQKGEHKAVPILVKVILRLRKHFFGGIEGPKSLKSLSPRQEKGSIASGSRARKISFSPSAMLLSAVGESSASEIRDVIEKDRLDVNQLSPSGKSLLHKAAASGDLESIHTLIQYGAKVNLTDKDGFAPVHSALRRCHYKCAIFLIECGTDMTAYTRTRIDEISMIKNMSSDYMRSVLNTPL